MPATLTLRVDDDTKIALEAVADARGTTLEPLTSDSTSVHNVVATHI